ncbi:MAG: hypothetical protein CL610_11735 [Anaerolineaceae bacterium]|nr:hypothetical protein [Anaerolineaceae bacterium]
MILLVIFIALVIVVASTGNPDVVVTPVLMPTATATTVLDQGTLLRVFPELRTLDIQAMRLEDLDNGLQLTLVRDEEGLWTAPDLDGELDEEAVSNIARTFVLFPYGRSMNIVEETNFEAYGLAPAPHLLFQILRTDGESHVVAVGDLTNTEANYFTLVDERDEIFLVERGPVDFLKNLISSPPIRLTN